ncbi:hypothetical protein HBB16_20530 [Pseudonocardia sp. MCCB 268]|nr:hypothetical protein [Pseudonocardia cytotoxica]
MAPTTHPASTRARVNLRSPSLTGHPTTTRSPGARGSSGDHRSDSCGSPSPAFICSTRRTEERPVDCTTRWPDASRPTLMSADCGAANRSAPVEAIYYARTTS